MTNLEHALDDCLARLASSEAQLEDCLALYPEHAGELRRLLLALAQLERARSVRASSSFKARTLIQLRAHMAAHPRGPTIVVGHTRAGVQWRPRPRGRSALGFTSVSWVKFRLGLGLAVLVTLFLVAGTSLAQTALPGHAGYGWKIASERVWRVFQPDPLAAEVALANRRADELALVADDPHAQAIALQGYRQALEILNQYTLPAAQPIIHQALVEHKRSLDKAGLEVPELNKLLTPVSSGPAPPASTPASTSTRVLPVPTLALPSESTLVSLPKSTLAHPLPTIPPVLSTPGSVSSTKPGVPTLALPLPTLDSGLPSH